MSVRPPSQGKPLRYGVHESLQLMQRLWIKGNVAIIASGRPSVETGGFPVLVTKSYFLL